MLVKTIFRLSLNEEFHRGRFTGEGYTLLQDNRHEHGVGNH